MNLSSLRTKKTLWVTPGGGLWEGEDFEKALRRELYEELGLNLSGDYPWIFYRDMPFTYKTGEEFLSEERFFLVYADGSDLHFSNMDDLESRLTKDKRWWSAEQIKDSSEPFFVEDLDKLVSMIAGGHIPQEPLQI